MTALYATAHILIVAAAIGFVWLALHDIKRDT